MASTATSSVATVGTYEELIGAMVARRRSLGLSQLAVDDLAGLPAGYTAKIEISATNPNAKNARSLGKQSLPLLLGALDIRLAIVPHGAAMTAKNPSDGNEISEGGVRKLFSEKGKKGAIRKWARMTPEQKSRHIRKMNLARIAKQREARKREVKPKLIPVLASE